MTAYCVKCRIKTKNLDSKTFFQKNCGIKNSRFVKEQEAKGLLSSLERESPLNKIPLLGDISF